MMIIVTDVETAEVMNDGVNISHLEEVCGRWQQPGKPSKAIQAHTEYVEGKKFRNHRGETVVIGMTEAVQAAIGLPMEAFQNMNDELYRLRGVGDIKQNEIRRFQTELGAERDMNKEIKAGSFWQRVKWMFRGY